MSDLISRQAAISAICNACGKIDCDKMDKCEKLQLPPANSSEFPNNSDTISRQAAIDDTKARKVGRMINRDDYCKDCDRSIYGKYHDCDVNIENNGKYVMADDKCYCKIADGKRAEKYPWERREE